jgi:hypothetical protein
VRDPGGRYGRREQVDGPVARVRRRGTDHRFADRTPGPDDDGLDGAAAAPLLPLV